MALSTETLHARKREASGTRACRRLRASGQIPAIVYGHQKESLAIEVSAEELGEALRRHVRMFELALGQQKDHVLLREVQYDAFGSEVVHADFFRVAMDQAITLEVPIQLKGQPKVEHSVLQQTLGQVEIECLPKDIPESILAMVGDLVLGQTVCVRELAAPPGVKILTDPEVIVATLSAVTEEAVAPAAPVEGAVGEPEVIGRKIEPEEGEEEEGAEPPKDKKEKESK